MQYSTWPYCHDHAYLACSSWGHSSHGHAGSDPLQVASPDEVINVLTVASGHMYERLQKIMFLSVINNTK
jgi:hypothetical protein